MTNPLPGPPNSETVLPGCIQYFQNGFNMKPTRRDFAGQAIFTLTYSQNQLVTYGPQYMTNSYAIPDHVTFTVDMASTVIHAKHLVHTIDDLKWAFTLEVKEADTSELESLTDDSKFSYKGEILQDTESVWDYHFCAVMLGQSRLHTADALPVDPTFLGRLTALAATPGLSPDDPKWTAFLDAYGTHYLIAASYGGVAIMVNTITKALLKTTSEVEITQDFDSSYGKAVEQNTLDVDSFQSLSTLYQRNTEDVSNTATALGGLYTDRLDDYVRSVLSSPTLLLGLENTYPPPQLGDFSDFVTDATQKSAIRAAILNYVGPLDTPRWALLGDPQATQTDTAIALTGGTGDVFLNVTAHSNNDVAVLTDGSTNPFTSVAALTGGATLTVPVRVGEYYNIATTQTTSSADPAPVATASAFSRQGMGAQPAATSLFGPWQDFPLIASTATPLTSEAGLMTWRWTGMPALPTTDGFMVCWSQVPLTGELHIGGEWPVAFSLIPQLTVDGTSFYVACGITYLGDGAEGAQHSYSSVCFPWFAGGALQWCCNDPNRHLPIAGGGSTKPVALGAHFLPLAPGLRFAPPQARSWNTVYSATALDGTTNTQVAVDGFVLATGIRPIAESPVQMVVGDPLALDVRVGIDPDELQSAAAGPQCSRASALCRFGGQSLLVPVQGNSLYYASLGGTNDPTMSSLWWIPLVQQS
jgi:hypothetical protein